MFVVHSYSEMSIISPTTCGFAKVPAFSLVNTKSDRGFQRKNRSEDIRRQFAELTNTLLVTMKTLMLNIEHFKTIYRR